MIFLVFIFMVQFVITETQLNTILEQEQYTPDGIMNSIRKTYGNITPEMESRIEKILADNPLTDEFLEQLKTKLDSEFKVDKKYIVQNSTNVKDMGKIIEAGAYVAGIQEAKIFVLPFNKRIQIAYEKKYHHKISGHVVENKDGSYVIYLDMSLNRDELIKVISHELIHIKQMQKNQLEYDDKGNVYWDGKKQKLNIPYDKRKWEEDAKKYETFVFNRIKEILNEG